ncbi:TauD/TfdA family dioxygenase [Streptomyces sp. NPDC056949]|uniref:TauD/TfdA family dioxygenase n=1 Tax=Streptomyces sp. NPDC056949 TaxID=3345976 RepID=UPI00363F6309
MTPVPHPIQGPTAWTPDSLKQEDWLLSLGPEMLKDLEQTRTRLSARKLSLAHAMSEDFGDALQGLGHLVRSRLQSGPGFVILRGWAAHRLPEAEAGLLFWGIACSLGVPQPQSLTGDRLHVVAEGITLPPGRVAPGGSTSSNEILLHTENARPPAPPDILGLLCLEQAESGGDSVLLSGHALHNRLLEHHPEDVLRLYQEYLFGRHDEPYPDGQVCDGSPVFRDQAGKVLVRYGRYWMRVAERTTGVPLDAAGRQALDRVDAMLVMPTMALTLRLCPGDALFIDNHVVLHGRRAFEDPQGGSRRRLLRVWVADREQRHSVLPA